MKKAIYHALFLLCTISMTAQINCMDPENPDIETQPQRCRSCPPSSFARYQKKLQQQNLWTDQDEQRLNASLPTIPEIPKNTKKRTRSLSCPPSSLAKFQTHLIMRGQWNERDEQRLNASLPSIPEIRTASDNE